MNSITVVKQVGRVAATVTLICFMALLSMQIHAQIAFNLQGDFAHNNRHYGISIGKFDPSSNLLGVEMTSELYDSGVRFAQSGSFYYIGGGGAGFNGIEGTRGIVSADFDKDGKDDTIRTTQYYAEIRYHALDKSAGLGVEGAILVTTADVNMDTWMDLIVVKNNGEILTFINNRITPYITIIDGNEVLIHNFSNGYYKTDFPSEWIISGAQAITAGLIDNNGRQGLAIANADGNVYIYLPYNGGGADEFYWSLVETKFVGNNPTAIAIGDVGGDGTLDLVTANTGESTISVLIGLGNGLFEDAVNYNTGTAPVCVAIGDCNNDGLNDVFVGNSAASHISYFLGSGFAPSPLGAERTQDVFGFTHTIGVGDFNGDNNLDLVYGASDGNLVTFAYGQGNGDFNYPEANTFFQGSIPIAADLDGDGDNDVIALNSTDQVAVYRNDAGTLHQVGIYYVGALASSNGTSLAVDDIDGDGDKDIVVRGFYRGLIVIKNLGGMSFGDRVRYETTLDGGYFKLVDLNGDNRKDAILYQPESSTVEIRYNDGTGAFLSTVSLTGAGTPRSIATGNLDGDTKADMVIADENNNQVSIWRGVGNSFTLSGTHPVGSRPSSVNLVDLNGDNKLDLVVTTRLPENVDNDFSNDIYADRVSIALGNGNLTFGPVVHYITGYNPIFTQIADLNYDGVLDIVTANTWNWSLSFLQGKGNGTFVNGTELIPSVPGAGYFMIANITGNPLSDIIVGSTYQSRFRVYQNTTPLMTVSGNIQIQNRTPGGIQVTFEFRRNNSSETFTRKATLNAAGNFNMSQVIAGDYTVHVKPPMGLAQNRSLSGANGNNVSLGNFTFRNGDATGDNAIDISDLLLLIAHYNQQKNTPANNPNYLATVDFNNDNANDIGDLLILINGYNLRGDQ